ncbi:hypothetical protein M3Y99_00104800 [Aphelenchoides fujianensis]|nr:hypothetical protein M3Y99_00104800 [Aphelenchoides fujianensis]
MAAGTRGAKLKAELERLQVKDEELRKERAKRRHTAPSAVVVIDSDGEREEETAGGAQPTDGAAAKRPRRAGAQEAGPSGLQAPQIEPTGEEPPKAKPAEAKPKPPPPGVKQEPAPPRKKKKREEPTAAHRMREMERQIEQLQQRNAVLNERNAERESEIIDLRCENAALKRKIAQPEQAERMDEKSIDTPPTPETPAEDQTTNESAESERTEETIADSGPICTPLAGDQATNAEICGPTPALPNDQPPAEKPKLKLKPDVRRTLMIAALSTKLKHNKLDDTTPNYLQDRAALQLRALRLFACCRAFSTVFFERSERDARAGMSTKPMVQLGDAMKLRSAALKPFKLTLKREHVTNGSIARLLCLRQANEQPLTVRINSSRDVAPAELREWTAILSTLKGFRQLRPLDVQLVQHRPSARLVALLQKTLPERLTSLTSSRLADFQLLAPKNRPVRVETAAVHGASIQESESFDPLFRSNARVIDLDEYAEELSEAKPCKRNPVVEQVRIFQSFELKNGYTLEKEAKEVGAACRNLRSLNDRFALSIRIVDNSFKRTMTETLKRGRRLLQAAEEAGIAHVQVDAMVRLPSASKKPDEHQRVRALLDGFFARQPEFADEIDEFDRNAVPGYETYYSQPVRRLAAVSGNTKLRFLFVYCVR